MAIRQLTPTYEYVCEACGVGTLHDTLNTRPAHWTQLTIRRNNYDSEGMRAIGDGTIDVVLCPDCSNIIIATVVQWLLTMRNKRSVQGNDGKVLSFEEAYKTRQ